MRTLLLILLTVVAVVLAAGVYVWIQPPPMKSESSALQRLATRPVELPSAATSPATAPVTVIQSGEEVWVTVPDEKTNEIAWRFKASRYDPQPDNSVDVTRPQAEFYFRNGQIVRIDGARGRVIVPGEPAARGADFRGPNAPPSRGELFGVVITLINADNPRHPVLRCRVNNVAFDNDTFRIATESFTTDDGTVIPADQVPVIVQGDDYDFSGKGLSIRWNDRDRRLQLLEIAHGDLLTIKSQELLQAINPAPSRSGRASPATRPGRIRPATREARAAVADPKPAATAPATRSATPQPVYRASFDGGVRVTQGAQQLALADVMRLDFMLEDQSEPLEAPARGGAAPATRRVADAEQNADAAGRAARRSARPPAADPVAPLEPVIVSWPGKLLVVPLESSEVKLVPGQRNVEMLSKDAPVVLNHAGSELRCASFLYSGADDSLLVRSSEAVPLVRMTDSAGAVIHTPSFRYSGADGRAVLEGAGHAEAPIRSDNDPGRAAELLKARWSESCILTLSGQERDELAIQQAQISGEVRIDHPQVRLNSDTLLVDFAAPPGNPATRPAAQVRQLLASGSVNCELVEDGGQVRRISSDRLALETARSPEGRLVPALMTADGNVHTSDSGQDLYAGHLTAKFAPATRPSDQARIESILAQHDVRFSSTDASGSCDQLVATAEGEDFSVELLGHPAATVKGRDATLVGPLIQFKPKDQRMQVIGAGSLSGLQPPRTQGATPVPFEVSWKDRLSFDGLANRAEVAGEVSVSSVSADGTANSASGRKLDIVLIDNPQAPATQRAQSGQRAGIANAFDSLGGKTVRTMTLDGDAEVRSILADAGGAPLRRMHLFAPAVRVEAEASRLVVPSAGRLLYDDRRPSTRPTATAPAGAALGDLSGSTAFQWGRELIYDQARHRAEMLGQVVIVHQQTGPGGEPFRLESERVAADLEPEEDASRAATKPAAPQGLIPNGAARVKLVTADGGVRFVSRQIQFDASQVLYDPNREVLIAEGSDREPVQVYDDRGISTGAFEQIQWNTRTQQIERLKNVQAQIRR